MLLWAAFVWGLGGDDMSRAQTSRIMGPLIDWLFSGLSWQERSSLLYTVRKSAHVIEYAILALLSLRALWLSWRDSLLLASVFSAGVVSAMAVADELRQARSPVRTGTSDDVLLDVSGGLAAIAAFLAFQWLRRSWGDDRAAGAWPARHKGDPAGSDSPAQPSLASAEDAENES